MVKKFLGVVAAIVLAGCQCVLAQNAKPMHEAETQLAWQAFEKQQFDQAIEHANKVIDEFGPMAMRLERDLVQAKVGVPAGKLPLEQKREIFRRGPLNDVCASWFVKGRSFYKAGKTDEAKRAFGEAAKLTTARVYDDKQDLFWSPAAIAKRAAEDPSITDKSLHEIYTADAWAALNRRDYSAAVKVADDCLAEFLSVAEAQEVSLTKQGKEFPVGTVTEAEKQAVFQNGLLNDVSTVAFIKGKALEAQRKRPAAVKAYQTAAKLTHGRCWDPMGWFWGPASAAADRIEVLK